MSETIFDKYQPGQWQASSSATRIAFPVISIREGGGNRIVERERPYRDGSKLDDIGSKAKRWTIEAKFENSIQEPGINSVNGDVPLYPDVINNLIDSFDLYHDEAGDLAVPTRGWVRARLETYDRNEDPDEQDCASLSMTFVEDNEDRVDARSFTAPSVAANAKRLSEVTTFSAQTDGMWDQNMQSLEGFASDLEALANAPGDMAVDLDQTAGSTIGSVNRVGRAFSDPSRDGRNVLNDPEASSTQRKLEQTKEIAGRSKIDSRRGRPPLQTLVFERAQSLVSIAAIYEQPFEDLLDVNPNLPDPLYIPPKTPVKVFVSA